MKIVISIAAALLTGCASVPGAGPTLDNAPVCEIGRSRAYVVSMFGWMGLSFRLTDDSAAVMCRPARAAFDAGVVAGAMRERF